MNARDLVSQSISRTHIAVATCVLIAGTAMALPDISFPDCALDNPGALPLTETHKGVQNVLSLLQRNQGKQASGTTNECVWAHSVSTFSDYTYTDSRDKRRDGYVSHMRDVAAGVNFLTIGDVAVSLMGTYEHTAVSALYRQNGNDNVGGLTLTVAKNIDWFLMGVSVSHNEGEGRFMNEVDPKRITTEETVAPFIGATYTLGNLSLATIPTYVFDWNLWDYDSSMPEGSGNDHISQQSFVWMNTADYKVTSKLTVGFDADWTRLTNYKKAFVERDLIMVGDRVWLTVGPRVKYAITSALSIYGDCMKTLESGTYDTLQLDVGLSYNF